MKRLNFFRRLISLYREPDGKKKLTFFLLCLFCSSFFWLFIQLSREAQTIVENPITIENVPEEVVISHLSQRKVRFTMRATGARLLVQKIFFANDTLTFDARQLEPIVKDGEPMYLVPPAKLINRLASRLNADKFIINVVPDTVFVRFSFAAEKKVPVLANISMSFSERFGQTDHLVIKPDSIVVRGPGAVVDTLSAIFTTPKVLENLNLDVTKIVGLYNPAPEKGLSLGTHQVEMYVPVGELLQTTLELPLAIKRQNSEDLRGMEIILFPKRVTLSLLASQKLLQSLDSTLFEAYVLCPLEQTPPDNRLEVHIGKLPPFISVVSIHPEHIEFLIQP